MKNMKIFLSVIILGMIALLPGCTKEDNTTGDSTARSAFLGNWNVQESYTKLTYEVNISADPNSSDGVFISKFAGTLVTSPPASASVNGSSIVLDADQVIGEGLTINGSGVLSGGKINWNYTIFDQATLIHAVATYTRP